MVMTAQDTKLRPGYKQTEVGMIPEEWDVKKVGEIGNKFFNGGTPSTQRPEYWSGTIPWITGADIVNQRIGVIRRYITKEAVNNSSTNIIEEGNLLLVTRTGVGKMTIAPFDVAISQDITGIYVNDKIDVEYLFRFFDFNSSKLKELNQGTSITGITRETLITTLVAYPPIKSEQIAIASVLSDTDALIESLDRLIAKKRDIKQATMQQLLTGKIRLPGFSGEWEVKELEEIREKFVNGGTPSTQKSEYWQGNIPWITGADVINQRISDIRRFITIEAVKNSSTNIVERGNLLLVTRTGVGKLAVASFDVAISQDITGIYVKKEQASIEYLFHYFNYSSETLKSLNQGTSIAGITRETLLSTKVYLPPLPEQRTIATVLSDMDAEIAALEQKRDKTRALKQAMMQELLTGKTRLV